MKTLAKILSLALALTMLCGVALGEGAQLAAEAQTEVDMEAYEAASTEIYDAILGDFTTYYTEAKEAEDLSERFALMAIAEAKIMESGVMIPLTTRGGRYSISRVAPRTINSTLWGNDSDRFHNAVVATELIKPADRDAIKAQWVELAGTGTFEAWVKQFLTDQGYTLKDTYTIGYTSDPQTWDALATSRAADSEAIVNTYDGLMEYDIENVQQPALATEYTVSEDGLTYTFKIREGVDWVDSQGRKVAEVKADDFVAGMEHMMDAQGGLEYLVAGRIKGADAYISGETTDFSEVGVSAPDDQTLVYTLEAKTPYFLTMLGYSIFAPMSRDYYLSQGGQFGEDFDDTAESYQYAIDQDHIAYCGPYLVTNATENNTIVFEANPTYWNADNINIHTIRWLYNDGSDATKAYNDMKNGDLSGVGLNAAALEVAKSDGWFDQFSYVASTNATSYMGFFNVNRAAFANANDASAAVSPRPGAGCPHQRCHAERPLPPCRGWLCRSWYLQRAVCW